MRRGFARFSTAAEAVAQGNLDPGNVVGQIEGQRTYEMNAAVLRTADEMLGTLLDTKACSAPRLAAPVRAARRSRQRVYCAACSGRRAQRAASQPQMSSCIGW